MRRRRGGAMAMGLAILLAVPADGLMAADAGGGRLDLSVTKNGAPDAGVEIALNAANMGKVALTTTDSAGNASFAFTAANLGKAQVQVVTEQCPTGDRVWLVGPDGKLPPEGKDCKRRKAGAFVWGETAHLNIEIPGAAAPTSGPNGGSGKALGIGLLAGGAVLAVVGFGTQKNDFPDSGFTCDEAPSQCSKRTGLGVAGLVVAGAGGFLLYRNSRARTDLLFPAGGGWGIRQTIQF